MTTPNPAELDKRRHELTNGLLAMREQLAPVFDTADGMRADMEKRGWSPTAAEQVALAWLLGAMNIAMGGVKR
ncbi:hypothetical protein [Streptomyces shenzhenensis]|uniref:Uncharacterized protein n=1 Tax=Streptomyces shenzhenensis TaxID=943815 RepID=A0A3M0I8P0_9ACTN|nr:hypothetical protein [Streptomyces shenzhenensis]RMB85607.1 hypothetical protein CTZ28_12505 [Streptomyces shenzhenensis]